MKISKDDLIKKLNIQKVDEDVQDKIIQDLANIISMKTMNKLSQRLSDDDLNQLDILIDEGDDGKIEWFIKSKFDNYDHFVDEIEAESIEEISNNIAVVNASLENKEAPKIKLNLNY